MTNLQDPHIYTDQGFPNLCRRIAVVNGANKHEVYQTPGSSILGLTDYGATIIPNQGDVAECFFVSSIMRSWIDYNYVTSRLTGNLRYDLRLDLLPVEGHDGGMYDIQDTFATQANSPNHGLGIATSTPIGFIHAHAYPWTQNQCFIPTCSGLAEWERTPGFDYNYAPMNRNDMICDAKTPFDNVYIPDHNQPHITVDYLNAAFITQEIDRQVLSGSCPSICTEEIDGPPVIVVGQTGLNYPFDIDAPSGSTVHWDKSSNLTITSSNNTGAIVSCNALGTGSYIAAWIENPCGPDYFCSENIIVQVPKQTGVTNINDGSVNIYPNPSNNEWHVSFAHFDNMGEYSITLCNLNGQIVWNCASCHENIMTISNAKLPAGMYFLKIRYNDAEKVYKIVKE